MPSFRRRLFLKLLAATALAVLPQTSAGMAEPLKKLEIIAPASPGGGWDQTARTIQALLEKEGLAAGVQVQNIAGAGGTIGLAQFVTSKKGKGDSILVAGQVMQGAIITNNSPVSLADVTPLALITAEYEALVVPADSPINSLSDLVEKLKADPGGVSWGGGSIGGTDQILAGLIAKSAGVDPKQVNYIAHSGGGEAIASILGGHVTVGVSGLQEFLPQITAGKLRAIAISSGERLAGVDIPTLKEQGVDLEFFNWRGLMAPPGIGEAEFKSLSEMIAALTASESWKTTLKERNWVDVYKPADEFGEFLKTDREKIAGILKDIGLAN